ncbi:NAD(+) synthase [Candidatus Kirkpatrickella diaphorinae]|uniref:Glutamine-dependent NAD(+) synthetase n=1 Tax=Candidatus Kirkpatrickella diaphorinae TaxID=2984322 RepID=A0ABY6GKK1_9PROT|nr:NAD(+) synthase [Candidatus Kirkpatrickella diaphorinae]UYH51338.1 NAD(+) synthase [Candidatus Kirkpatrickella diaphorinae]
MEDFYSIYSHGMARVSVCTFPVRLAVPLHNAEIIAGLAAQCEREGSVLAVFPELCLTGYSLEDLRHQTVVIEATHEALRTLAHETRALQITLIVGAALRFRNGLYNCAVVLQGGRICGVVPKSHLPEYAEFYESRHFSAGSGINGAVISVAGDEVPFGCDLIFRYKDIADLILGVEICEDLWVADSPHIRLTRAGVTVMANLSASSITIGKSETRDLLCRAASLKTISAYLYAAAGEGESTTDLSWDGQVSIYEMGDILAQSERFPSGAKIVHTDIDLERIVQERLRRQSVVQGDTGHAARTWRDISLHTKPPRVDIGLKREIPRFPFLPNEASRLAQDCFEAWTIQVTGLIQRLRASGVTRMVIGVSGGLDSTLALLVCRRVAQQLDWPAESIHAYTMPGFATGDASKSLAVALMRALNIEPRELDIRPAATRMLSDLDHPHARGEAVFDTTFENVQAGLRTDYLFRIANQIGGIVIGTGDLSELALGWCTYGVGDQMSHYNVNTGMPKTLIQHVLRWLAAEKLPSAASVPIIQSIIEAEISPELVPAQNGSVQRTEDIVGPYDLQDFFLYFTLRYGLKPSKIAFLTMHAWLDPSQGRWPANYPEGRKLCYTLSDIRRWLEVFLKRFFSFSQFKRSAMPNGPKISPGGALSPRGDWRMPSDSQAQLWLDELFGKVP